MKRASLAVGVASVIGSLWAGALCLSRAAHAAEPSAFTFRLNSEPETLDWNRAHTPIETHLLINLMEGLVSLDDKARVQPGLAQDWQIKDGGKTYIFKLRPSVQWSDGVALKASDFVASWKRLLMPDTAAAYAYLLDDVVGAEAFRKSKGGDFSKVGIRAVDDRTLEVKLSRPVAHWIFLPSFWVLFPVREDLIAQWGRQWTDPSHLVTVGPFTLASHEIEQRLVLKANSRYWRGAPALGQVTALIVKEDTTALSLYEAGKLDFVIDLSALDLARLQGRPDLQKFPYLKTGYMGLVADRGPLANVKLRKAIALAVDRSKIPAVLRGGQSVAGSFVPAPMLAHLPKLGLPYDLLRAKAELKASGWDVSKPIRIVLPNWDKPMALAQWLQGELKRGLGLTIELNPLDNKMFRAQLDQRTYPAFISSWNADYPDPDNFLSLFLSSAGNNRTGFKDADYDSWIVEARGLTNTSARAALYQKAQKRLQEDAAVVIPLFYEPNFALVRPTFKGVSLNPLNYLDLRKVARR